MPKLIVKIQNDEQILRVGSSVLTFIPTEPYAGHADVPAGTIPSAVTFLADTRALKSETATLVSYAALESQFNITRAEVDDFDAQLTGIGQNQVAIRADLEKVISDLTNLNSAGLTSQSINSSNELIFSYDNGSSKNLGFFPVDRFFKGTAGGAPTVAGTMGDLIRNTNPAVKNTTWLCTTSGAAGVAVWEPRGAPVYAPLVFDFNANGAFRYQVEAAQTVAGPNYGGTTTGVTFVWEYAALAAGTSWVTAVFPLAMAANSILRCTVTGIATNGWATTNLKRTA